jgi:glycosyltransferase involved in cell wall biosynthesis
MRRSLVLLTLNEIDGVRVIVPQLPEGVTDEIVAVDGGSTDGTREFLAERGIRLLDQERRGRGEAFRVAMAKTRGENVVFFSPDGNEDVADIRRLFEALESGADMAIASRFMTGSRNEEDDAALPLRKLVNRAFTWIANAIWNGNRPWITDTINGFRGIRRAVFDKLAPTSDGATIEYELTIKAMRSRIRIVEIPTIESDRIGGVTKVASWPTGVAFVRILWREIRSGVRAG